MLQLGHGLMNELLDLVVETPLEDFGGLICEALIGAFHSAAQRIERDADKARDSLNTLLRDFDGSEVLDVEIQEATHTARAADVATLALEMVRDAASASYTMSTGDVWSPWKGNVRGRVITAAQVEARDALRAHRAARHGAVHPGAVIVAFRAAPQANSADDANRIFDALNWAQAQWPDMALAGLRRPAAARSWPSAGRSRRRSPWSWPRPISTAMAARRRSAPTTRCWRSIRCAC